MPDNDDFSKYLLAGFISNTNRSLPLYRARRFGAYVVDHPVDASYFIDYPVGNFPNTS